MKFKLKLPPKLKSRAGILRYAEEYGSDGDECMEELKRKVRKKGFLTREQLKTVAYWKAPRAAWRVDGNTPKKVEKNTRNALAGKDDRDKFGWLTDLDGVAWAMASVILHWFDRRRYPIWDFRALWTCTGIRRVSFSFPHWEGYTQFCREVASEYGVDMRTLDRALWSYSKAHQPRV